MKPQDWRNPGDYAHIQTFDAPGFAWEYLRRNPEFIEARRGLDLAAQTGELNKADADAFARRWGVRFRKRFGDGRAG